jgi:sporulation protein YlmC with PRC-barrel domain
MTLRELIGLPVRTESGEGLGRVHDVRGRLTSRTLRVEGLVVGGAGVLERLGIGDQASPQRVHLRAAVPWSAVVRVDRRGVVVRDGTEPR